MLLKMFFPFKLYFSADSAVEISAGTGTNIDTRTEATNGNHRQVVVVGDPATNAGVAPVDATAGLKVDLGADNDVTVSGSVAVTNAGLTELAAAIDTEVQVDIVGALPAGTNAIGKLAANSGVDIGDVDVTSVVPGSGATNLGKAEDAAHSSGDVGVMSLTVRQDTAAALGGTDADYQPLITDGSGRLHVNVGASAIPTGAATAAKQDTMIGHLDGVEGLLTTIDGDTGTIAGAVAGSEMQVDVVAALPAGTNNIGDVDILSIAAGDNNIGNVDVVTLPAIPAGNNNIGDVDVASIAAGDNNIGNVDLASAIPAGTNFIGHVGHGQTLKTKTGSASATFTLIAAVADKKLKVYSLSLITASTTAVTVTFKDGAAGTALATYPLQAISGTNFGLTENVPVPSILFQTSVNTLLEMSFSAAQSVTYNLRYFEES